MPYFGDIAQRIEVEGICETDALDLDKYYNWTQLSLEATMILSDINPDIGHLDSVNVKVKILSQKVITTTKSWGKNIEGLYLTGRKLVIEGEIVQFIYYTGDLSEHSVHTEHFKSYFSADISIPERINGIDTLEIKFQVNPCVEDVLISEIGKNQIFENIILLIQAVPTSNCRD